MKLIGIFGIGVHMLHALSSQTFEHKLFIFSAVKMDHIKNSVQALLVIRENFLQHPFPVLCSCVEPLRTPSLGVLGTQKKSRVL